MTTSLPTVALKVTPRPVRSKISVASAKGKGRRLQQWVRDTILSLFHELEPDDVKSTSMGASGEDIQLSPAARRLLPISVECKSYAKVGVYKWYDQAISNCPAGSEPVLVVKMDRKKPLVVVDADHYFKLRSKV